MTAHTRARGEGSIYAYRKGRYAAYVWVTTPGASGAASTSTVTLASKCTRVGSSCTTPPPEAPSRHALLG